MMRAPLFFLLLTACSQFPQVDGASTVVGPAPALLPMDQLIAQTDQSMPGDPLAAQITALQARAAALRNTR